MGTFNKMLPLILIAVIFVIGLPFVSTIMGSVDNGVNLTETDYQDQYNSTTETSIQSLALMQVIPLFMGVIVLILGIFALRNGR